MQLFRVAAVGAVLLAGCYTLQPVLGAGPEVGTKLAFDVNDVGRVALGGTIGPEVGQIEGQLVSQENGEFVLAVSAVRFLRGGEQVWTGEKVRLRKEYVGNTYERRFHRGRTVTLGAVVVGGLFAIAVSQDLFGLGQAAIPITPPETSISFRGRRP